MSHCLPMNSHGVNDTKEETNSDRKVKTDIYHAPLGESFDKILTSYEVFIRRQATCGFQLIVRTGILSASLWGLWHAPLFPASIMSVIVSIFSVVSAGLSGSGVACRVWQWHW